MVNWLIHTVQGFSAVEESSYQQMIDCASNSNAEVIKSHSTIKADCEKMHLFAQNWVIQKIQVFLFLFETSRK